MIHRRVSAVVLVRDGYSGLALASPRGLRAWVDGVPAAPVWKPGGWLVFADLAPGPHQLRLSCRGFADGELALPGGQVPWEGELTLQPGPGYPFRTRPVVLRLTVTLEGAPLAGEAVWLAPKGQARLKLAQDGKQAKGCTARLFCQGSPAALPIPGWFLAVSSGGAELVHLRALRGETGELDAPLALVHSRGTSLAPAAAYPTGPAGELSALLRQGGPLWLFCRGYWREIQLTEGEQAVAWALDKEEHHG